MYIVDQSINNGLRQGQEWPSNDAYRQVAVTIAINNPNITTRDKMLKVVQAILKVPPDQIEEVSYRTLIAEFKMPDVKIHAPAY